MVMINKLEEYLVKLLQGYITWDDQPVEVVKHFSQHPSRPVITLDLSTGVTKQHRYHEPSVNQQCEEYHATVNVNVWCDTEEQRQCIVGQVLDCFEMEQDYHYRYCRNYLSDGLCRYTGTGCRAVSRMNNRCPRPREYLYMGLRESCDIIVGTLNLNPAFELDELGEHPPLLRSVLACEGQFFRCRGVRGVARRIYLDLVDDGVEEILITHSANDGTEGDGTDNDTDDDTGDNTSDTNDDTNSDNPTIEEDNGG